MRNSCYNADWCLHPSTSVPLYLELTRAHGCLHDTVRTPQPCVFFDANETSHDPVLCCQGLEELLMWWPSDRQIILHFAEGYSDRNAKTLRGSVCFRLNHGGSGRAITSGPSLSVLRSDAVYTFCACRFSCRFSASSRSVRSRGHAKNKNRYPAIGRKRTQYICTESSERYCRTFDGYLLLLLLIHLLLTLCRLRLLSLRLLSFGVLVGTCKNRNQISVN